MYNYAVVRLDNETVKIFAVVGALKLILVKACKAAKLGDVILPGFNFYEFIKISLLFGYPEELFGGSVPFFGSEPSYNESGNAVESKYGGSGNRNRENCGADLCGGGEYGQ